MRFKVKRYCIEIVPENEQDEAYIEEVLGLRQRGECAVAMRRAPIGLEHALAYVEVYAPKPPPKPEGGEVARG